MGTGSAARRPRLVRAHRGALPVMGRRGALGVDWVHRAAPAWRTLVAIHSGRPWTTCSSKVQETPGHPCKTSSRSEHPFPPDDSLGPPL